MKPLLAHIYEPHRVTYPCYVQPKLNGIRALYQNGRFQSRDQLPFPVGLLDHLAKPLLQTFDPNVVLDGELYVHGWPLQRILSAVTPVATQRGPTEDTLQVEYHVFDVVDFEKSFNDRFTLAEKAVTNDLPQIKCVHTCWVDRKDFTSSSSYITESCGDLQYAKWVANGYEGMMYRLGDCPYTVPKQERQYNDCLVNGQPIRTRFLSDKNNRCWHLLKRKDWQDDEFFCVAVEEGQGKLTGTLGALKCSTEKNFAWAMGTQPPFAAHFSVGSGLTDAERDHYWRNPPIGKLIKVKYLVLSQDGIPLNPTILAVL